MSVTVANTTASLSGKTLAKLEDSQTFTGQKTFDLGASAPFVVVSGAAVVPNLDADKLDGEEGTDFHDAAQLTGLVPATGVCVEQTYASTGTQNDVAPSAGAAVIIRCTGAAPVITGFTGGAQGRRLLLICLGTTLKVSDQTGSTAANQIICQTTAGLIVGLNGFIELVYDTTTSRWRAATIDPGEPIAWTPSLGGSATYTAREGRYTQHGKTVTLVGSITVNAIGTGSTTTISGVPIAEGGAATAAVAVGLFASIASSAISLSGYLTGTDIAMTCLTAGSTSNGNAAVFGNGAQVDFSCTYLV